MRQSVGFACHRKSGTYANLGHIKYAQAYASADDTVVQVAVTEDANGIYWAWWEEEDGKFRYLFPHKDLVDMCFPYGSAPEEADGRGKLLQVRVDEVLSEEELK